MKVDVINQINRGFDMMGRLENRCLAINVKCSSFGQMALAQEETDHVIGGAGFVRVLRMNPS